MVLSKTRKPNQVQIRIEFKPKNIYFNLPKPYFKNLTREQLLEKLTLELEQFLKTENFKNSFLTKANAIVFETTGHTIWSKRT